MRKRYCVTRTIVFIISTFVLVKKLADLLTDYVHSREPCPFLADFDHEGMRILVTGAAGFVGHHLVQNLTRQGIEVIPIDNFHPAYYPLEDKFQNRLKLKQLYGIDIIDLSICDADGIKKLLGESKINYVIHAAAHASVAWSREHPEEYFEDNVQCLEILIDTMEQSGVYNLIMFSSSTVYGAKARLPMSETDPKHPTDVYGETKTIGELWIQKEYERSLINAITIRPGTIYGPEPRKDMRPYNWTYAVFHGEPIKLYEGDFGRDFVYIDDVVQIVVRAMIRMKKHEGTGFHHEIYNVGYGVSVSLELFIKEIGTLMGKEPIIVKAKPPKGEMPRTFMDVRKAHAVLCYTPQTNVSVGLKEMVDWFQHPVHYEEKRRRRMLY